MVNAEVDFNDLYNTFSDSGLKSANLEYTNQAFSDMQRYVPMEFGPLRSSGNVVDYETIVWNQTPYAAVQYYTQFQNYTTPGTGPHWDKVATGNHMRDWEQVYVRGLGL